jgi:hypothetical protein
VAWRWAASDTDEWRRCERKRMGGDPYQRFLLLPSDRPASSAVPPHAPASAAARPCSSAHTRSSAPCLAIAARTSGGDGAAARARAWRWRELCEGEGIDCLCASTEIVRRRRRRQRFSFFTGRVVGYGVLLRGRASERVVVFARPDERFSSKFFSSRDKGGCTAASRNGFYRGSSKSICP